MKRIARIGDLVSGVCYAHHDPVDWTGTFNTGSGVVTAEGQGVARIGDTGSTSCGHTFRAIEGSGVITADGISVAREGDHVEVIEGGTGIITGGSSLVRDYS